MIREEIQYLFDRGMFGMKMGLNNILDLLNYCNVDYKKLASVHIAGTNGKGSTSNIIAQTLTANGYKTGLFTSPHLQRFNERIKIDNIEIPDEKLSEYINFFKEGIEKFNCTFFEANTAIALKYFLDSDVDIAVIETGLGGRLDATNILTPIVSVITGIDRDHEKQLGSSLVQIAKEKAGIIKKGIPVVLNFRHKKLYKTFRAAASKKGSRLVIVEKNKFNFYSKCGSLNLDYYFSGTKCNSQIDMIGEYQKDNLRTSLTALKVISKTYPLEAGKVSGIIGSIRIKGRMEMISSAPPVLIDAAHNSEGLRFLKNWIDNSDSKNIRLVAGMVKDKDYEKSLCDISNIKAVKYFTEASNKRMLDIETMKKCKCLVNDGTATYYKTPIEAYNSALNDMSEGDLIIVSGSHFVIGDFLNEFNKNKI
jgi:dihydrofolate synthase / folylpolyglutamate synthase